MWWQNLSGAPRREPRQAMAGMDELSTATEGLAMDTESAGAAAADEVDTPTSSATDGGIDDRGEQ